MDHPKLLLAARARAGQLNWKRYALKWGYPPVTHTFALAIHSCPPSVQMSIIGSMVTATIVGMLLWKVGRATNMGYHEE